MHLLQLKIIMYRKRVQRLYFSRRHMELLNNTLQYIEVCYRLSNYSYTQKWCRQGLHIIYDTI